MCLLGRILATNRDEFLDRPTEHARFRRSFKGHVATVGHAELDILCGLDLQAGGTWLGLDKSSGRVTFLYVVLCFGNNCGGFFFLNGEYRTNITEPFGTYELSRGYLMSSLLVLSSPCGDASIQEEIQRLLDLEFRFAGFNLLVFVPHLLGSESEDPWRLSYEVTKLSNNGGGRPIFSRSLTSEEQKGGAMSNGIDGEGADEWPKVKGATRILREVLRDDLERKGDSDSSRKPDEEVIRDPLAVSLATFPDLERIVGLTINLIAATKKVPVAYTSSGTPSRLFLSPYRWGTPGLPKALDKS